MENKPNTSIFNGTSDEKQYLASGELLNQVRSRETRANREDLIKVSPFLINTAYWRNSFSKIYDQATKLNFFFFRTVRMNSLSIQGITDIFWVGCCIL